MFNYDDFKKLLSLLDQKLKENELYIEVFAIGGFAMMCNAKTYGFNSRELSIDIDTYMSYSEDVLNLVDEVSSEFEILTERWLNTHWYDKKDGFDDVIESFSDWKWEKSEDLVFSNIELYYANLEGLLKMKLSAINEKLELDQLRQDLHFGIEPVGTSVRINDLIDVKTILAVLKEDSLQDVKNAKIKKMFAEYEQAFEYLKNN